MSQFVVNLKEPEERGPAGKSVLEPQIRQKPKGRRGCVRVLGILGILLVFILAAAAVTGFLYWQNLKTTPQYSLALLVDAARRNDQAAIDELVDTDAVVENFMPQITEKAVELYGKNLPPATLTKVAQVAAPLMPAVKQRAREEVPRVIREKTQQFDKVPFWSIAIGAGQFLDIQQQGDVALIRSTAPGREIEISMKKNGDKWQVVGIKDEALARRIAESVGQELIAIASKGGLKKAGEKIGVPDLENLKKKLESIFGQAPR